jgi:hypothetical protein
LLAARASGPDRAGPRAPRFPRATLERDLTLVPSVDCTEARGRRGQPLPSRGPLGLLRAAPRENRLMSTEDDPKKLGEDDAEATSEWHRARAKNLRKHGFTRMAEEHEQIARTLEHRQREQETK